MQNVGHGHGVRTAFLHGPHQILRSAHTTTGDNGNRNSGSNHSNQIDIKTLGGSFLVHGGQEYLARPEFNASDCPFPDIHAGPLTPVVGVNLPFLRIYPFRLDGKYHALRTETLGYLSNELRTLGHRRVDGHLVSPGAQKHLHVFHAAHSTADRHRHKHVACGAADNLREVVTSVKACHRIHIYQLIDTIFIIMARVLLRITDDTQSLEVYALDEIRPLDVEARDQADIGHYFVTYSSYQTAYRNFQMPFSSFHRCGDRNLSAKRMKYSRSMTGCSNMREAFGELAIKSLHQCHSLLARDVIGADLLCRIISGATDTEFDVRRVVMEI